MPLDGECDSDLALLDEEVDLSLANTGAVLAASYVSSVTNRFSPVKEHLARVVSRLMVCVYDMLAAFAELLAATFALTDVLFAATPGAYFWDSSRGFALALFGLSPAAVVPWETGGLLQGPVCFQPYLGSFAALMAAMMGAAICLAALLAAMKLAATSGRMVSGSCSKFWAGQAKEKLLSGWVLGSYLDKVMLQIPQVGRCRVTDPLATVFSAPAFPCIDNEGITTAAHAMDHFMACIIKCLPVPMSLDDKHSLQLAEASVAAAACKGSPRFQFFEEGSKDNSFGGGIWYEAATCCCCLCE